MNQVAKVTGRHYHLFDYIGHPEASAVVVVMGAAASTVEEICEHLNSEGKRFGVIKVRLYRPWSPKDFLAVLPKTAERICVLDRTKEPGSFGEPLYLDVATTL